MAFRNRRREKEGAMPAEGKILDVDASMQGSLVFRDPINLCINGRFEGSLDTRGNLVIGENAYVKAHIVGEDITIAGKVIGNVTASSSLNLTPSAYVVGDIRMPNLTIASGAVLQGKCQMETKESKLSRSTIQQTLLTVEELAKYLEVDSASILDWAKSGRIPAQKIENSWKFDRDKVNAWIASEKIK